MLDGLKEALQYVVGLGTSAEETQVLEICGKTYANRNLTRYDKSAKAEPVKAATLSSMVDYIAACYQEFPGYMLIHVVSPKEVRLVSQLDGDRERETLFVSRAEVSEFRFDTWMDQERFMIDAQANFQKNKDLEVVLKMVGNIEKKNAQEFSDDGTTQTVSMILGVAVKGNALVPNPVDLVPYRTFQEVAQPRSSFVFRVGNDEQPVFKLVEAEGGIWKNEAIRNIKDYFFRELERVPQEARERITVIG